MRLSRAALASLVLALIGLGISGEIARVHSQMSASAVYVPGCNITSTVNCSVVLDSKYAHFAGLPVAWWALLTYLLCIGGTLVASGASRATLRRQAATALFVLVAWSALFSAYLAFLALFVLKALCLLCSGLYVVNAGLFVSTWLLLGTILDEAPGARHAAGSRQRRNLLVAGVATVAVLAFAALGILEIANEGKPAPVDEKFRATFDGLAVEKPPLEGGHARGAAGKVMIVEFSDFECAHCAKAHHNLKTVLPRFEREVQLVFHHFPLDNACNPAVPSVFHQHACLAAMAAECAAEQGRFWDYADILFANQSALGRDDLLRYADRARVERAAFLRCLDGDAPRQAVARDVQAALDLKILSTPTFFINGRRISGEIEPRNLEYAIRAELAKSR